MAADSLVRKENALELVANVAGPRSKELDKDPSSSQPGDEAPVNPEKSRPSSSEAGCKPNLSQNVRKSRPKEEEEDLGFVPNKVQKVSENKSKKRDSIAGMEGGAGESSYTRNSRIQAQAILKREISELNFDDLLVQGPKGGTALRVADLGCSVGANTLGYAGICFQSVQESCRSLTRISKSPDVQYFFSDLPSNDFNTLFQQLEDRRTTYSDAEEDQCPSTKFYAAAVPGSFYGRLFPGGSLHVVISIFALQWMSQVPDAVMDKASAAYNKGRVWIDGVQNPTVSEAYAQTARDDLQKFLLSRADEVASGGLVVFYNPGRADERHPEVQWAKQRECCVFINRVFEATWEELVAGGFIEEETRDSFNIPLYFPSLDEVRAAVDSTNAFDIKRLEIREQTCFLPDEVERLLADPEEYGRLVRNATMSLLNSYIVQHIGEKNANEFFERLERNQATAVREKRTSPNQKYCYVLAVLVRK